MAESRPDPKIIFVLVGLGTQADDIVANLAARDGIDAQRLTDLFSARLWWAQDALKDRTQNAVGPRCADPSTEDLQQLICEDIRLPEGTPETSNRRIGF